MDYEIWEDDAFVMETGEIYGEAKERRPLEVKIVEHLAVFRSNASGWAKELNMVSWGGNQPKFDIREWSPDHTKMSKGVTLSNAEAETLFKCMQRKGIGEEKAALAASF